MPRSTRTEHDRTRRRTAARRNPLVPRPINVTRPARRAVRCPVPVPRLRVRRGPVAHGSPLRSRERTHSSAQPPTKLTTIYQERIVHTRPPPPHSEHIYRERRQTLVPQLRRENNVFQPNNRTTCRVHTIPHYTVPFTPARCKVH